jgi:hypothetical protein
MRYRQTTRPRRRGRGRRWLIAKPSDADGEDFRLTRGDKLLRAGTRTIEKLHSKSPLLVNKLDISVRCKALKERNIPSFV